MSNLKRSTRLIAAAAFAIPLGLSGCAQHYSSPTQAAAQSCKAFGPRATSGAMIGAFGGAATGAAIGGLAGHNGTDALIGAGIGAVTGAIAGSMIGHHLDQRDCAAAELALQQMGSAPTNVAILWNDPHTGSHGSYTPTNVEAIVPSTGEPCRPVNASYYLHGHKPVVNQTGMVCRSANGNWHMQTAST